jgi:hypothetical protein
MELTKNWQNPHSHPHVHVNKDSTPGRQGIGTTYARKTTHLPSKLESSLYCFSSFTRRFWMRDKNHKQPPAAHQEIPASMELRLVSSNRKRERSLILEA